MKPIVPMEQRWVEATFIEVREPGRETQDEYHQEDGLALECCIDDYGYHVRYRDAKSDRAANFFSYPRESVARFHAIPLAKLR